MDFVQTLGDVVHVLVRAQEQAVLQPDRLLIAGSLGDRAFFGMVANYQVVTEMATRAVVRVNPVVTTGPFGFQTNYNLKIEHFDLLAPDDHQDTKAPG